MAVRRNASEVTKIELLRMVIRLRRLLNQAHVRYGAGVVWGEELVREVLRMQHDVEELARTWARRG